MEYTVTNVRLEAPMFRALKLRALERGVPAAVLIADRKNTAEMKRLVG